MRYIKTYEIRKRQYTPIPHYEIGEYIKLKTMSFYDLDVEELVYIPDKGKIINLKENGALLVLLMEDGFIAEYTFYNVERKMTPEEIQEFELKISTNKYNL